MSNLVQNCAYKDILNCIMCKRFHKNNFYILLCAFYLPLDKIENQNVSTLTISYS